MNDTVATPAYAGYRFPPAVIAHAVWRYCRFSLRYRDVAELLAERGVLVADASVRQWCRTSGQTDAHGLRRRRPRPGDTWPLDAGFMRRNGATHERWRAVDQDGHVLASLVQGRRDTAAARQCFRRLRKDRAYVPRVVGTDKRASDGAAQRAVLPSVEHRQHQRPNNRAGNAHRPTRERARRMRRCKRPGHARRFRAASGPSAAHFRPRRHRLTAEAYRETSTARFQTWHAVTGTLVVACARARTAATRLRSASLPKRLCWL